MQARQRWARLSPRSRRIFLAAAAGEGLLKGAAIVDLVRRPASGVRGRKLAWATALILVNSAGTLPVVYFRYGRRPSLPPDTFSG